MSLLRVRYRTRRPKNLSSGLEGPAAVYPHRAAAQDLSEARSMRDLGPPRLLPLGRMHRYGSRVHRLLRVVRV